MRLPVDYFVQNDLFGAVADGVHFLHPAELIGAFKRLCNAFRDRSAECDVPKYVLQAIVDDMMPDIRAFFESEEGKREFEEWKAQRENKPAEGEKEHKKK